MKKGLFGIGSAIGIGILCVGCSNNSPLGVSVGSRPSTVATISSALEVTPPELMVAPGMVESTMYPGNFEIVRRVSTATPTSLEHRYWTGGMNQWSTVQATFGDKIASDPAVCAMHNIAGNPATPYELHVIVREQQGSTYYLVHWKRSIVGDNQYQWVKMGNCQLVDGSFISGVIGTPAMVCNRNNNNFEVLVRTGSSTMSHFVLTPSSPYWHLHGSFSMGSDAGMCQASNGCVYASGIQGSSGISGKLVCWENAGFGWRQSGILDNYDYTGYRYKSGIAPRTDGRLEIMYAQNTGVHVTKVVAVRHNPSNGAMGLDGWVAVGDYPSQITVATLGTTIHMHCYTNNSKNQQFRIYE